MLEQFKRYADVLLNTCLKVEKNQPLFISYNKERQDFVDVICDVAKSLGIDDIFLDKQDPYLKHDSLFKYDIDELKKLPCWNKKDWDTYSRKGAAFLMLASETPGLMKDVDQDKLSKMTIYSYKTRDHFNDSRDKALLAWCIAAVPTESWAKEIFPDNSNPVEDLWNKIFEMCLLDQDYKTVWDNKIKKFKERAKKLNDYNFKTIKYTSSNGTNFSINLPENHIWATGYETLANGKEVLVNFPTEEIFTSPDKYSANGIVYSSKPLSYQNVLIDNFYIEFKDGKVINFGAEKGEETLKSMINICENSNMLGEVALVPNDSPISNTNLVYLETLFDENAACHLALGDSFLECIQDGPSKTKDELFALGLNKCESHVDFMIGNKDLNIKGITKDNKEIDIFVDGNFSQYFD